MIILLLMGHYIKGFLMVKSQINKEACHLQDCRVELC
jgi:hypothetical protein